MKSTFRCAVALSFIILSNAASGSAAEKPKGIYGEDDRRDLYEVQNPLLRRLADSTVAIISRNRVSIDGDTASIRTESYSELNHLCSGERFYEQRVAAFCSGALIAPNIIMTAGHCFRSASDCGNARFVFGFGISERGKIKTEVPASEVYQCSRVIDQSYIENSEVVADYALIELDRPVLNHPALEVDLKNDVERGTRLAVIGHPNGLPTKVADGARVRSVDGNFFTSDLDTYGGNSGSSVFDVDTGKVVGILVRGDRDFEDVGGCQLSRVCEQDGCNGEQATRVTQIRETLLPLVLRVSILDTQPEVDFMNGSGQLRLTIKNEGSSTLEKTSVKLHQGESNVAVQDIGTLKAGESKVVTLSFDGLDPSELLNAGVELVLAVESDGDVLTSRGVLLKGENPYQIAIANPKTTFNVTEGSGELTAQITNNGKALNSPATLVLRVGNKEIGSTPVGNLGAGQRISSRLTFTGIDPNELIDSGVSAKLFLRIGKIRNAETEILLKGKYPYEFDVFRSAITMDVANGTGVIRVRIKNLTELDHLTPLKVLVRVGDETTQTELPFIRAGEAKEMTVEMPKVDPLRIIDEGLEGSISLTDGKLLLPIQPEFSVRVDDTRTEVASYFDALVNGRGFLPGETARVSRIADFMQRIVSTNSKELFQTDSYRSNPYSSEVGSTMLGKVLAQYVQTAQTDAGRRQYHVLAQQLWAQRKILKRRALLKTPARKSYELLCQELPLKD